MFKNIVKNFDNILGYCIFLKNIQNIVILPQNLNPNNCTIITIQGLFFIFHLGILKILCRLWISKNYELISRSTGAVPNSSALISPVEVLLLFLEVIFLILGGLSLRAQILYLFSNLLFLISIIFLFLKFLSPPPWPKSSIRP